MIVDTSALIAIIILREPDAAKLLVSIRGSDVVRLSAANLVEASLVRIRCLTLGGQALLDYLIDAFEIEVVPVTHEHAVLAQRAFHRFGKCRHPAGLNFGDCFAHALARQTANHSPSKATTSRTPT